MAYPGSPTSPGTTTWPGIDIPPIAGEIPVPSLRAAPQGVRPQDALLLVVTPPSGRGSPIVRECPDDLTFGSVAPGGYNAMTATLSWPDGWPPPDGLVVAATAQVVDGRNGEVVWHGHIVDPGYTRTGTGASHQIAAQGYSTVLDTTAGPLAYVDRDLSRWSDGKDYSAGTTQVVDDKRLPANPSDWLAAANSVLEMDVSKGSDLDASAPTHMSSQFLPAKYSALHQDIVSLSGTFQGNSATADFRVKIRAVTQSGATVNTVMDRDFDTTVLDFHVTEGDPDWTMDNARVLQLRLEYSGGADAQASRDYWLRWGNLAVIFRRNDQNGDPVTDPSTYVRCHDLVDDIIGRALKDDLFISADVARPTALVEQAAWWEGISARELFEFISTLEPDYYWAVWSPVNNASRLPRFEYRSWRTSPRYVIPPDAGTIQLAGGGDDLADVALIAYQASGSVPASTFASIEVPELRQAGVSRTARVDLSGDGPLSEATAQKRGADALARLNLDRSSGTATVWGPVLDLMTGRMVEPWEIRAGWMVVVGDGVLRADGGRAYSLTGSRDGRSTFRLTETSYSASPGQATLTLDGGSRSLWNRVRRPLPKVKRARQQRYHVAV